MKEKLILLLFLITSMNIYMGFNEKKLPNTTSLIKEAIELKRNKENKVEKVISYITIPKDFTENKILIHPHFLEVLNHNQYEEKVALELHIKNLSFYSYHEQENSLVVTTDDLTRYGIEENFLTSKKIEGFDHRHISEELYPYRIKNEALSFLCSKNCSKEEITKALKKKGYIGSSARTEYYLDFYNKKYNLAKKELKEFSENIIREIFQGKVLPEKEDEPKLIALAYNFYYQKVITLQIGNKKGSMEVWMKNQNEQVKMFPQIEKGSEVIFSDMKFQTDATYQESFPHYHYMPYIAFTLEKFGR